MTEDQRHDVMLKELDILARIVERLSGNSLLIKGWAATLIVAALITGNISQAPVISLIPWLSFWILDAFYFQREKQYRRLYEWVVANRPISDEKVLSMDLARAGKPTAVLRLMWSPSEIWFYGPVGVLLVLLLLSRM
jgi:uncharacterized membrane protein YbaN (DUF454 family)